MYNRYIPEGSQYTPVNPPGRDWPISSGTGEKKPFSPEKLLRQLRLDKLDTGDILLALIVLLLWKESEDSDLLLAFGAAMLLGNEERGGEPPQGS